MTKILKENKLVFCMGDFNVNSLNYTPIHYVKFSASNGDRLEYNGSQGANGLD